MADFGPDCEKFYKWIGGEIAERAWKGLLPTGNSIIQKSLSVK
jgi:hypothetical protein